MLSTAKTDTLSAELSCLLSVSRSISVCSYLKSSVLISPSHNSAESTSDLSVNSGDDSLVDVTCCAVDRDVVALNESLSAELELLVFFIHLDVAAA